MVTILLFIIIFVLIGYIAWTHHQAKAERKQLIDAQQIERNKYINAIIAKKAEDLRDLTLADKVAPLKPEMQKPPDLVPENQVSDEDFDLSIQQQLANS